MSDHVGKYLFFMGFFEHLEHLGENPNIRFVYHHFLINLMA